MAKTAEVCNRVDLVVVLDVRGCCGGTCALPQDGPHTLLKRATTQNVVDSEFQNDSLYGVLVNR